MNKKYEANALVVTIILVENSIFKSIFSNQWNELIKHSYIEQAITEHIYMT